MDITGIKKAIEAQNFIDESLDEEINRVFCTDYVHLSEDTEKSLVQIWKNGSKTISLDGHTGYFCPNDLLFQDTVPLKNMTFIRKSEATGESEYRVHIFENYYEFLPMLFENEKTIVGMIEVKFKSNDVRTFLGIAIMQDHPNILVPGYLGCYKNMRITQATFDNDEAMRNILSLGNNILGLWYATQLCLLNPVTEVLFSKPAIQKLRGKEKLDAQKVDKKIKYIKRYYIKEEDVDRVLYGGDRSFNRKCLVWYVTGHWREYKTGKRTFIKGYFKGALRNTPNADVARKRELVIDESEVAHGA